MSNRRCLYLFLACSDSSRFNLGLNWFRTIGFLFSDALVVLESTEKSGNSLLGYVVELPTSRIWFDLSSGLVRF